MPEHIERRPTGILHTFRLLPAECYTIEIEDVHFHLDSAVMLPSPASQERPEPQYFDFTNDALRSQLYATNPHFAQRWYEGELEPPAVEEQASMVLGGSVRDLRGLHLIAAPLEFAAKNPGFTLLVAGHAEPAGRDSSSDGIAVARAQNVAALLNGDRGAWYGTVAAHHRVEDYQFILSRFAAQFGWACDPGPADGDDGQVTRAGVRGFQLSFNEHLGGSLRADGVMTEATWLAIFDTYQAILAAMTGGADELAQLREHLEFVDSASPAIGCGDRQAIAPADRDALRSIEQRRVEALFFPEGRAPSPGEAETKVYVEHYYRRIFVPPRYANAAVRGSAELGPFRIEEIPVPNINLNYSSVAYEVNFPLPAEASEEGLFAYFPYSEGLPLSVTRDDEWSSTA